MWCPHLQLPDVPLVVLPLDLDEPRVLPGEDGGASGGVVDEGQLTEGVTRGVRDEKLSVF